MASSDVHKPGGGKNPLPWSKDYGFSGMDTPTFRRYWLRRWEFAPLFFMVGCGTLLGAWCAAREFIFNPRYMWAKSRRESFDPGYTEEEVDRFRKMPSIPHPTRGFSLFGVSFTPMATLEADKRPRSATLHPRLADEATPPRPKGLTSDQ